MKTQTYEYVLQRAVELTGRVWPPSVEQATMFRGYIAAALRKYWEKYTWPETMVYQQEYFGRTFNFYEGSDAGGAFPGGVVTVGDIIYDLVSQKYWKASHSFTIDATHAGPTDGLEDWDYTVEGDQVFMGHWAPLMDSYTATATEATANPGDVVQYTSTNRYFYYLAGEGGLPADYYGPLLPFRREVDKYTDTHGDARTVEIGEVVAIYKEEPRVDCTGVNVRYEIIGDKILVRDDLPYVWVLFRTVPPSLTTDPTTIPYRFAEACALNAAGKMLMSDGKMEFGFHLVSEADSIINDELDKVTVQEGQSPGVSVSTR